MSEAFCGTKAALFYQDSLLVYLRDDKPGLPFAACWDFPGGGREGQESPFACLQRETLEEFGILLHAGQIVWQRSYPSWHQPGSKACSWWAGWKPPRLRPSALVTKASAGAGCVRQTIWRKRGGSLSATTLAGLSAAQ
jgi:8-oxo-dGTP diphosphatase